MNSSSPGPPGPLNRLPKESRWALAPFTSWRTLSVEKSAIRKISIRLVPFVALMFFINYLDRTAIGFAAPSGMNADLGLSAAQFGFASGIFFLGYIVLEVPSNLALHKFGARRWLVRIMISWGIVAVLFTFVQNFTELTTLRPSVSPRPASSRARSSSSASSSRPATAAASSASSTWRSRSPRSSAPSAG